MSLFLPAEIILLIAESLSDHGDINALLHCSRYLYSLLNRFLYLGQDGGKRFAAEWAVDQNYPPTLRILKNLGISLQDCEGDLLHIAATKGNLEVLEYILDTGEIDIESMSQHVHIDTPLIEAAHHGQTEAVKMLLDRGAKPSRPGDPHDALIIATNAGNEDIIKLLLSAGADIHSRDRYGMNAVLVAGSRGMLSIMTLLLDSGADIFSSAGQGQSLLRVAAKSPNGQLAVEILLKRGALVKGEDSNELLRDGVMAGWSRGVCEMLIQKGADVNYKVEGQSTPLLMAAIQRGSFDVAALFIHNGADVNATDIYGETALHLACGRQHISLVKELLAAGADVSATTSYGEQPLGSSRNLEVVKLLLTHGAECRHVNNSGSSALITAISERRLPLVKLLLEYGTKLDGGQNYSYLLHKACSAKAPHIVNILLKHGPVSSSVRGYAGMALRQAVCAGYTSLAESLVQHGASVDQASLAGWTLLMEAARKGRSETIKVLCGLGAGLEKVNERGYTALLIAATEGELSSVDALLCNGADPRATSSLGRTALLASAEANDRRDVLERLLQDKRTDINARDMFGRTALLNAAMRGHEEAVRCLLAHDQPADATIKDHWGATPLSMAVRHGHTRIVELLLVAAQLDDSAPGTGAGAVSLLDQDRHGRTILDWARCTDSGEIWRLLAATVDGAGHNFLEDTKRMMRRFREAACYCVICGRSALCSYSDVSFCYGCDGEGTERLLVCRFCIDDGVSCVAAHDTAWGETECTCLWEDEETYTEE